MDDRTHISTRSFGETPPEFKAASRDLRIDIARGIALWWIFLDHVPNNIGSWLTPRNYGFCDAAEIFMFISGVTCALAYDRARQREGWSGMIGRSLRRGWDIYAAFLLLTLACAILVYLAGSDDLADDSNTRILLEHPGPTLAHAAILQYRPVNTDVLPVFVIFHTLFAPLLWLLLRAPNVTLGVSLLLYALVHVFGWTVPAWPGGVWFFNPLAWQLLIVLGAWSVIEGEKLRPWVMSRWALVLAVLYLACGLVLAQSWSIEALIPQFLTDVLFPLDKSNLSPIRLLHFLALAIVVLRFIPRNWAALSTPALSCARWCGEKSLPIYCLGVLLALASQFTLLDLSEGLAMQILVSFAGVSIMIVVARLLNAISLKRERTSGWTQAIDKIPLVR
ncbi:OpgC family protein [Bradyrhizobium sp. CCGUVB14]|uniref:OpgC family protein n=1 Tax=Bradyrhizobium sp. CCGUVB14 TaxID=2949628 RepID=UPI0020B23EDD|nr:OpgC domain-containing protein [Bradyrhizobium sp. CCGUVB14]MCP3446314.1 OpgC domain-containing protein [Bradyrhizobium sp. CCGUVB14]